MRRPLLTALLFLLAAAALLHALPASAQGAPAARPGDPGTFTRGELVESGHQFFGNVSRGLALTVEEAVKRFGEPTGYILGQEASAALIGGVTYGEGRVYTRAGRGERIYWQGPSVGFDAGGDGSRTMMLVYNMTAVPDLYRRFPGIEGSAYVMAGFGLTAMTADGITVVPIRSGVGLRLGVSVGYLRFSEQPTWNPF